MAQNNDITLTLGIAEATSQNVNAVRRKIIKQIKGAGQIPLDLIGGDHVLLEVKKITTGLQKASKEAKTFSDAIGLAQKRAVAYSLATVGLFKLSNAISTATHAAINFEVEQAKIAQTIGKSNKAIKEQSADLLRISRDYGIFATKVGETLRILTQAGFTYREALKGAELLSKTTLLASFEDLGDTTEGLISLIRTFNLSIYDAEQALNDINVVSKRYAVEADDIVQALKRAGGVFAVTGGNLRELIALFTTVRDTTREGAETIATAFRTIFARLQRPKTIEYFKDLNIQLTDAQGKFVGNLEAIDRISKGLNRAGISPGSVRFAEVVEEIGGIRQISKVIPLLTQSAKTQKILQDVQKSSLETDKDVALAKETLSFKVQELQRSFDQLFIELSNNETLRSMLGLLIDMAKAATDLARALQILSPGLAIIGGYLTAQIGRKTVSDIFNKRNLDIGGIGITGKNKGGIIHGIGNRDTELALLTPGEFVINAESARRYGYANLQQINKYAKGGPIGTPEEAQSFLQKFIDMLGVTLDKMPDIKKVTEAQKVAGRKITGTDPTGAFSPKTKNIYLEFGKATGKTVAHELAHLLDDLFGEGKGFASKQEGTAFNKIVQILATDSEAKGYKKRPEELFADFIAKIVGGGFGKGNQGLGKLIFSQGGQNNPDQLIKSLQIAGVLPGGTQKNISDDEIQDIIKGMVKAGPTKLTSTGDVGARVAANEAAVVKAVKDLENVVESPTGSANLETEEVAKKAGKVQATAFLEGLRTAPKRKFSEGFIDLGRPEKKQPYEQFLPPAVQLANFQKLQVVENVGQRRGRNEFTEDDALRILNTKDIGKASLFEIMAKSQASNKLRGTQLGAELTFSSDFQSFLNQDFDKIKNKGGIHPPIDQLIDKSNNLIADQDKQIENIKALGGVTKELAQTFLTTATTVFFLEPVIKSAIESFGLMDSNIGKAALQVGELTTKLSLLIAAVVTYTKVQNNATLKEATTKGFDSIKAIGSGIGTATAGGGFKALGSSIKQVVTSLGKFNIVIGVLAAILSSNLNSKEEFNKAVSEGDERAGVAASIRGKLFFNMTGDLISGTGALLNIFTSLAGFDIRPYVDYFARGAEDFTNLLFRAFIPGLKEASEAEYKVARTLVAAEQLLTKGGIFSAQGNDMIGLGSLAQSEDPKMREKVDEIINQLLDKSKEDIQKIQDKSVLAGQDFSGFKGNLFSSIAQKSSPQAAEAFISALSANADAVAALQAAYEQQLNSVNAQIATAELSNRAFLQMLISVTKLDHEFDKLNQRFSNVDVAGDLLSGGILSSNILRKSLSVPEGDLGSIVRRGQGQRLLDQAGIIGSESLRQTKGALDVTGRLNSLSSENIAGKVTATATETDPSKRLGLINDILQDAVGDLKDLPPSMREGIDTFISDFSTQLSEGSKPAELKEIFNKFRDGFDDLISKDLLGNLQKLGDKQVEGLERYINTLTDLDQKRFDIQAKYNDLEISRYQQRSGANERAIGLQRRLNPNFAVGAGNFAAERRDIDNTFGIARLQLRNTVGDTNNGLTRLYNAAAGANGQNTTDDLRERQRDQALAELNIKESEALLKLFDRQVTELDRVFDQAQKASQAQASLAKDFAFGDSSQRRDQNRTFRNTQQALSSGIDSIRGRDRGAVRGLLEQFTGAGPLSFLGGKTAESAIADLTVNSLIKNGRIGSQQEADALRKTLEGKAGPVEERIASQIQSVYDQISVEEQFIITQQHKLLDQEKISTDLFAESVIKFQTAVSDLFTPQTQGNTFTQSIDKLSSIVQNPLMVKIDSTNVVVTVQGLEAALANGVWQIIRPKVVEELKNMDDQKTANPTKKYTPPPVTLGVGPSDGFNPALG